MSTQQRARSAEAKHERRDALLAAAAGIAERTSVREVTLTAITTEVGLHPSALRRYFESREEVLLELAKTGWADWRDGLLARIDGHAGLDADETAQAITDSLAELPLFCDLLTHVPLSLEGSVRVEIARNYKTAASAANDDMVAALATAVEGLDEARVRQVLAAAISIAAYFYQLAHPTPTLQQVYDDNPRWAHDEQRFHTDLTALLALVVRGAQASP